MAHGSKTKKWQIEAKPTWHKGPRPKSGKLRLNLHDTISKGKLISLDPKKELKRERERERRPTHMKAYSFHLHQHPLRISLVNNLYSNELGDLNILLCLCW